MTLVYGILAIIIGVIHMKRDNQLSLVSGAAVVAGVSEFAIGINGIRDEMHYIVSVKSGLMFVSSGLGYAIWMVILGSIGITVGSLLSLAGR